MYEERNVSKIVVVTSYAFCDFRFQMNLIISIDILYKKLSHFFKIFIFSLFYNIAMLNIIKNSELKVQNI